jgi:flavodoxin long chain
VGLFFGSTTGVTEHIAYQIQSIWQAAGAGDLVPVNIGAVKDLNTLTNYDYLILGVSTWNVGQLQDDWEIALPQLEKLNFLGTKIALFGLGDQYGYPHNFLDALGILGRTLRSVGASLVAFCNTDSYEFAESLALENGRFMGLGIDEIHQANLTQARIEAWVTQLIEEFEIHVAV